MTLDLEELRIGVMGLTPEFGSFCLQACTVCLDNYNHASGIQTPLVGSGTGTFTLNWNSIVDEQIRRNWKDNDEATEYGATAIAVLLAKNISEHDCIERASKGLGFDYWLGEEDSMGIFQKKAKLEISGIFKESQANTVENRARQKENQTKVSSFLNMNAHICIMEFSNPKCIYSVLK